MPNTALSLNSRSPDQTCRIAQALARHLGAGDTILLTGDVGAGKTHLARALIQALLPTPEDVPSPTYTLVQTYQGPACEIWHADLYRLSSPFEIEELGLTEAFDTAICLIEWPDRLAELCPSGALGIELTAGKAEEGRIITLSWDNPRWDIITQGVAHA